MPDRPPELSEFRRRCLAPEVKIRSVFKNASCVGSCLPCSLLSDCDEVFENGAGDVKGGNDDIADGDRGRTDIGIRKIWSA